MAIVPFSSITHEVTAPGATDRYYILDKSGTPTDGYITHANLAASVGLSYLAVSPTTGNVTAAESTAYVADISGLTANRDFTLPTPSAAGKRISLTISVGDTSYALLVKRNSTEVTRLFISGESIEFISTGTGAGDWVVSRDGRIPCHATLERQTAQTITTGSVQKINLATQVLDIGDIADPAAYSMTLRRAGAYAVIGTVAFTNAFSDQKNVQSHIYIGGVDTKYQIAYISTSGTNQYGMATAIYSAGSLAVGATVELYGYHNQGSSVDTATAYGYPSLDVEEKLSPIV